MAGHGGGAWKVAYADFVTAMMAFFMVMWITSQGQDVKEAVAGYFNDPFALPSKRPGSASVFPVDGSNQTGFAKRAKDAPKGRGTGEELVKDGKKTRRTPPRPKTGLFVLHDGAESATGTVVEFEEASANLTAKAQELLTNLAPSLVGSQNKIEIRGHSTNRPLPPDSPFQDAWQLAYARCTATMKFLVQQGVKPERIRLSQAGPYEPRTIRVTPDWEKHNSRVEVNLLDEIAEDLMGTREERNERFQNLDPQKPASSEPAHK